MRFNGKPFNITVIAVYAPTVPSDSTLKDDFYHQLQLAIDRTDKRNIMILAGDWNAQVGKGDASSKHIVGQYTIGNRCENGSRLVSFAEHNGLVISSSKFQHPKRHLLTWYSNDGVTSHQIDHILINSRWASSVEDCRAYRGAETGNEHGSDHVMVRARLKLRISRFHSTRPRCRLNTAALQCPTKRCLVSSDISSKLSGLVGNSTDSHERSIDQQWSSIRTAVYSSAVAHLGKVDKKVIGFRMRPSIFLNQLRVRV